MNCSSIMGSQNLPIWGQDGLGNPPLAPEPAQLLARRRIPQTIIQRGTPVSRSQRLAVGRKGQKVNGARVAKTRRAHPSQDAGRQWIAETVEAWRPFFRRCRLCLVGRVLIE